MARSSFLFSFGLTLLGTALLMAALKIGAGLGTEISLLLGGLGFFPLFALIRCRLADRQLSRRIVGFETLTIAVTALLLDTGMGFIFRLAPRTLPDYAFESAELRRAYGNELERANRAQTFEQYVMYRGDGFEGEFINQDADGVRATWTADNAGHAAESRIYMFGGSTLWGFHARDDHTIPSYLARFLDEKGIPARVTNHGVIRDSSSTELVRLFQLLKAGRKIDFVIFYDGFNDVASGVRGAPGRIVGYDRYKEVFLNKSSGLHQVRRGLEKLVQEHSGFYRLLQLALAGTGFGAAEPDRETRDRLAEETVDAYLETLAAIERLSQSYGFRYAAFWQPMAYLEPTLTAEERPRVEASNNVRVKFLVGPMVNERLPTGVVPNFFNISDALSERRESVYIDIGHLTERGNEIVAGRIGDILLDAELLSTAERAGGYRQEVAEVDLE